MMDLKVTHKEVPLAEGNEKTEPVTKVEFGGQTKLHCRLGLENTRKLRDLLTEVYQQGFEDGAGRRSTARMGHSTLLNVAPKRGDADA